MTVFRGEAAIRHFLDEVDEWVSEPVTVYLLGGSAMTARGLKDQTDDIDLGFGVVQTFTHVCDALRTRGFKISREPTSAYDGVGKTLELINEERGLRVDLFEQQIVGKVWLTDRMFERADRFWTGKSVNAFVLSDEDMFLLKAVSGGDLTSGRRRDIEDLRTLAQRGLNYDAILKEITEQRPFNTGTVEAQQIRDRSHPLFTIETAVSLLSGLPEMFTSQISSLATEFEVEYTVLAAVDDGINDIEAIRQRVKTNVRAVQEVDEGIVEEAIDRLESKRIVTRLENRVEAK